MHLLGHYVVEPHFDADRDFTTSFAYLDTDIVAHSSLKYILSSVRPDRAFQS